MEKARLTLGVVSRTLKACLGLLKFIEWRERCKHYAFFFYCFLLFINKMAVLAEMHVQSSGKLLIKLKSTQDSGMLFSDTSHLIL